MDNRGIFIIIIMVLLLFGIIYTINMYLPFCRCPQRVRRNINHLGSNHHEIFKACCYFQKQKNEEKLASLYFLLENMYLHKFVEVGLKDDYGNSIDFNASNYEDLDAAMSALQKLEEEHKELNWDVIKLLRDTEEITFSLLIENIESAHAAWKENQWSKRYSVEDFRNYILPYRGSGEPLESFRPCFKSMYGDKIKTDDPIEAASIINDNLKNLFRFNSKFYLHPTDLGLTEMLTCGEGRCEDMTNLAIYAMRANGIAVTSDYTPHWADSGNNHAWNSVLTIEGKAVPFMGCESNPGKYKLRKRIAKVYRKMFASQPESLGNLLEPMEKAPAWLSGKNYLDVTSDYVQTANVSIHVDSIIRASERFLYLAVFNDGKWEAIAWSQIKDGIADFKDVGIDLVFLPCYFIDNELKPSADAILLNKNGEIEKLVVGSETEEVKLSSTTKLKIHNQTGDKEITNLKPGENYELYYWEDEWKKAGEKTYQTGILRFAEVPSGGLYWLKEKESKGEERIFIYLNDEQIWY